MPGAGSSGRELGGKLQSSAAAAVAPRAAACSAAASSSEAISRRGRRRQAPCAAPALRDPSTSSGEFPVHGATLPGRSLLVQIEASIGCGNERARVVEHNHSSRTAGSSLSRISRRRGSRDQLDRRPRDRRSQEQDVDGLAGSRARRPPSSSLQAVGHPQRPAGLRPRARADELTTQLEREERISCRGLLHADELRPRQLEAESLLQQAVKRGQADRPERDTLDALLRKRSLELELQRSSPLRGDDSRADPRARRAGGAVRSAERSPDDGSSHCMSSSATTTGRRSASRCRTSRTASPIAR